MDVKVSVIVPVYGTHEYLRKCLDSIINQTLKEIEIILVNDASPYKEDHHICLEYEQKDNRIRYLKHDINKGLGETRNTGIKISKGKYISFIDSDDWIEEEMYQVMFKECEDNNLDIIQCNTIVVYPNGDKNIYLKISENRFISDKINTLSLFLNNDNILNPSCCNKLFKRSFLIDNDILFIKEIYYEDILFIVKSLIKTNNIKILKERYYNVFNRPNSTSRKITDKNITDFFKVFLIVKKILLENNLYVELEKGYTYFCKKRIFFLVLKSNTKYLIETFKNEFFKSEFSKEFFFVFKVKIILILKRIKVFKILKYFWGKIFNYIR